MKENKPEGQSLSLETVGIIGGIVSGFKELMELIHDVLAQRDVLMVYIFAFFALVALIVWGIRKIQSLHAALRFALPFLAVIAVIFGLSFSSRIVTPPEESGQVFLENVEVSLYAGNGSEDVNEETGVGLREARFSGVGSLSVSGDTAYLSDYSKLCVLKDGIAILSDARGGYSIQILHCHDNSVYFLTDVWSDSDGMSDTDVNRALYLGFARIRDGRVSLLYQYEAGIAATASSEGRLMGSFSDFAVASNGDIWFIEQNYALDYAILNRLPYIIQVKKRQARERNRNQGKTNRPTVKSVKKKDVYFDKL